MTDGGEEDMPKDGKIVQELLRSMNVEDYEPRVVHQFLQLWYRYVADVLTDAQMYSEHAEKSTIDSDDVKLAIQSKVNFSFSQPPPREVLLEVAKSRDKVALPKSISRAGIPLPPEQDTLIFPNYQLAIPKRRSSQPCEETEDDDEAANTNPNPNQGDSPLATDPREEVIQAWYMDDSNEDQRLPHHRNPKEYMSFEKLDELGVLSWRLDADNYETDPELKKIREERGYTYTDFCEVCPEKLPNYEEKIKNFYEEHLHTDEEIRYCVAGSGYFDVRDHDEAWIRVWVKKGALIVLPAGIYHRFTTDADGYIKAMRLFVGEPVWTPYNRPHDHLPARKQYVESFVQKDSAGKVVDAAA